MMGLLLKPLLNGVVGFFKDKAKLKQAKVEGQIAVLKTAAKDTAAWEQLHAKGSQTSWKDEFWTLVFAVPLIMGFVGYSDEAMIGFEALKAMSEWYQYTLVTMVLASFGIRATSMFKGGMK